MRSRFPPGGAALATLALVLLPFAPVPAAPGPEGQEDRTCARHDLAVQLLPEEPSTYRLAGWLCAEAPREGQTVLIASPTGFSMHAYWDWPVDKGTYSFVRHATREGYAVFTYDRIGTGQSDRPAAALVNLHSEAHVLHQLVQALRAGDVGGVAFGKVVLVGNSLSTLLGIFEAELYQDADGLINTGIFVGPSPVGLAKLFASLYPAQLDPKFEADPSIPPGYATTLPGSRAQFFHVPATDPAVLALDEALKDTGTLGEAATFPLWVPFTRLVDVPVLSVVGDHDLLACLDVCQPDGIEVTKERLFWGEPTCLEIEILPEAGHFPQLQPNSAADFRKIARDWLDRRIGLDAADPPTQPCAG